MRVFIICTGRTGSHNLAKACSKITNYTSGHESRVGMNSSEKINYPDNHIESDNRLSWMLGSLSKKFSDEDVLYVHLKRNSKSVANSYNKRWHLRYSIVRAFSSGILMKSSRYDSYSSCLDYVEVVNDNIEEFLKSRSNFMVINVENIKEDFIKLWDLIGAEGDLDLALEIFDKPSNLSPKPFSINLSRILYFFRKCLDYVWK